MDQRQSPGALQAIVNALRGVVGMPAASPGQETPPDLQGGYRRYIEEAASRGETPMPMDQWNQQQGGGMRQGMPPGMPQGMPYR